MRVRTAPLRVEDQAVIDQVSSLAERYAAHIIEGLPAAPSEEALRTGLVGSLLSFLAEAVTVANSHRAE